ncbi:MAG: helix-turn-helix domain-containing protein [Gammaproteobacteria bacterium]
MTQDEALDLLKLGENIFLTGAAGAGKSWLLNHYIAYLHSHDVGVAVTASTGVAATHLNGRTLHSWSGIGVRDSLSEAELEKLADNKRIRRNYTGVKVLIIDEISMLHPHQLDMVDRIARAILDFTEPFGGLQVVLSGDFFQLPPVSGSGAGVPQRRFAWHADAWQTGGFRVCYLHEQHRQGDDPLLTILNDIRAGRAGEQSKVPLRTRYKRDPEGEIRPTRLYARNINVDSVNERELAGLNGEERTYAMETRGPQALVDGLKKSCLAPEHLRLKEGAQVMFVRNANDGAYVNGTRGIVTGFDKEEGWPRVRTFDDDLITAAPVEWNLEENGVIRAAVIQVPLRLAWAITIHKSQGMTLDTAEIDLSDAFEPGMGYVALSRVRSLNGLKLMGLNETALRVDGAVSEQDDIFKTQSAQVRAYLQAFPAGEKQQWQKETLLNRFEGELEPDTGRTRKARRGAKKRPTHEITLELLKEKTPLQEMARQRQLKPGTILQHIEKLKGLDALPDIDYLRSEIPDDEFDRIVALFREAGDGRLAPVREKLGRRFSYEALRIARLFAW